MVRNVTDYVNYAMVHSVDSGLTWGKPFSSLVAFAVLPKLLTLPSGELLLSGGRPGVHFWVGGGQQGKQWSQLNLLAYHNKLVANPQLRYTHGLIERPCAACGIFERLNITCSQPNASCSQMPPESAGQWHSGQSCALL